jgi:hypothetical protein
MANSVDRLWKRLRRHQLHIWLSDREYEALRKLALEADETVSNIVRRVLCQTASSSNSTSTGQRQVPR